MPGFDVKMKNDKTYAVERAKESGSCHKSRAFRKASSRCDVVESDFGFMHRQQSVVTSMTT